MVSLVSCGRKALWSVGVFCSTEDLDVGLTESWGESKQTSKGEVDPLYFPVAFMMAAAINVPLSRAEKKEKKPNAGMERGSQVDKREKIR